MVAAGAVPVSAAPSRPAVYTVVADRAASIDVMFRFPVTLVTARSTMRGTGSYAGYYVQPLTGDPGGGVGELVLNGAATAGDESEPVPVGLGDAFERSGENKVIPPGRYRLHVLGDAATTVRLALRGAPASRSLRAGRPSAFEGVARDVARLAGQPGPAARTAELPITVSSARSLTFVVMSFEYRSVGTGVVGGYSACLSPADVPGRCHGGPYVPGNVEYDYEYWTRYEWFTIPVPRCGGAVTLARYYSNGAAVRGERGASFVVALDAVLDRFTVGAFSLAY